MAAQKEANVVPFVLKGVSLEDFSEAASAFGVHDEKLVRKAMQYFLHANWVYNTDVGDGFTYYRSAMRRARAFYGMLHASLNLEDGVDVYMMDPRQMPCEINGLKAPLLVEAPSGELFVIEGYNCGTLEDKEEPRNKFECQVFFAGESRSRYNSCHRIVNRNPMFFKMNAQGLEDAVQNIMALMAKY